MNREPPDPKWPRLLGLAIHELAGPIGCGLGYLHFLDGMLTGQQQQFLAESQKGWRRVTALRDEMKKLEKQKAGRREFDQKQRELTTPISVGSEPLRMLLSDTDGTLTERQRYFVMQSQNAWSRMATLTQEMSDLSHLEAGTLTLDREPIDFHQLLAGAVAELPPQEDPAVEVKLTLSLKPSAIEGDPRRLSKACTWILFALRKALVDDTTLFVREEEREYKGQAASWVAIGDADHIDLLAAAAAGQARHLRRMAGGLRDEAPDCAARHRGTRRRGVVTRGRIEGRGGDGSAALTRSMSAYLITAVVCAVALAPSLSVTVKLTGY